MVPKNFVAKYWREVSNPIFLKFPNEWKCKINWVQRGNDIWLLNWKKIARSLRCGDLLVFQYKGSSDFRVIVLDESQSEIDYSNMYYKQDESDEDDDNQGESDEDSDKQDESDEDDDYVEINEIATATPPQGKFIYFI
jgi:hypothetical protein